MTQKENYQLIILIDGRWTNVGSFPHTKEGYKEAHMVRDDYYWKGHTEAILTA